MKTNHFASQLKESVKAYQANGGNTMPILIGMVLDRSGSMSEGRQGEARPIDSLNGVIAAFQQALIRDPQLAPFRGQIQMALLSYNDEITVHTSFLPAEKIAPPVLTADSTTNSGEALLQAFDLIRMEKAALKARGFHSPRCLIFWLSDGETNIHPEKLEQFIRMDKEGVTILPFAMGTGANLEELRSVSTAKEHQVIQMVDTSPAVFRGLVNVLVASSSTFSRGSSEQQLDISNIPLPNGIFVKKFGL